MEENKFNFGQLTREMVSSRLKDVPDAASVAAEIARKTIVAGVQGTRAAGQSPKETVEDIVEGAMSGLLLIDKDLPAAAVGILGHMAEVAQEAHLDPTESMTWALEGVARVAPMIPKNVQWKIRDAINEKFMGVGEVFDKLCAQAHARPSK